MRINELQKAFAIATKAAEAENTPPRDRQIFKAIARHIWDSCGGTCSEMPRDPQSMLVEAADSVAGR